MKNEKDVTNKKVKTKKVKQPKSKKIKQTKKVNKKSKTQLRTRLTRLTRFMSNKFEELFSNNKFTLIATLILAVVLVQGIHSLGSISITKNSSSIVRNREVIADYDKEKFVVEGIPETVDIVLIGDDAAIQSTKNTSSYTVDLDLTSYGAGSHLAKIEVGNLPKNVKAQTDPNKVAVNIYTKEFKLFSVLPKVINEDAIEGLTIENPVLSETQVSLKGAEKDLKRVSFVQALIDGKAINATLNEATPGVFDGRAIVIAYDEAGNKIDNLSVDTGGIDYSVELLSPSGKPINTLIPVVVGNFPEGQAIQSITLDSEAVTINGSEEEIDKITSLEVRFDMKNIVSGTTIEGEVVIPEGANIVGVSPKKISAKLEFGALQTRTIEIQTVTRKNGDAEKYNYEVEDSSISVTVIGTAETLASLDESQLKAEADVAGLGEGVQSIGLKMNGPSIYRYEFSTPNVRMKITRK